MKNLKLNFAIFFVGFLCENCNTQNMKLITAINFHFNEFQIMSPSAFPTFGLCLLLKI